MPVPGTRCCRSLRWYRDGSRFVCRKRTLKTGLHHWRRSSRTTKRLTCRHRWSRTLRTRTRTRGRSAAPSAVPDRAMTSRPMPIRTPVHALHRAAGGSSCPWTAAPIRTTSVITKRSGVFPIVTDVVIRRLEPTQTSIDGGGLASGWDGRLCSILAFDSRNRGTINLPTNGKERRPRLWRSSSVRMNILYIKTKTLSVEKERSIDSKAQKKTNKITKFRINAFL